jgi:hypothetical protein
LDGGGIPASIINFLSNDDTSRFAAKYRPSAIEGIDLPPDIPININTLSNVLVRGQINDISFTIDNRLVVLIEHQSTINSNMPLRLLMYVARIYEKITDRRKTYQKKLEKIPCPEFIVLYSARWFNTQELVMREKFNVVLFSLINC